MKTLIALVSLLGLISLPVEAGERGVASWYSGYPCGSYTAAHKHLPKGTVVRVTNLHNGRSVVVKINDRGPYVRGRVIDVSPHAAEVLGIYGSGVAPVKVDVIFSSKRHRS